MRLRILRPAFDDLAAGRRFYDFQNQGVGTYFFDSVFADIDSLILYGGKHSIRFGFYRMVASRFPYLIFYKIEIDTVIVFRILPGRRDPNWIRAALRTSGKKK
jgi:plasmid stabilization system protein ParE